MIKQGDLYFPTEEFKKKALLNSNAVYKTAAKDPIKFWEKFAKELFWQKKWEKAFLHEPPYFKWFGGGKVNIPENCLERNLKERGIKILFIWGPEPIEEKERRITYQ